jgi:type II secretory pathway pseudopilin PulG
MYPSCTSRYRSAGSSSRGRIGFTLGEVLVTVAVISLLAAVVVPAIGSELTKGDQSRLGSDLMAMRGAMEQFMADVRRYPNSVGQLTTKPTADASGQGPLLSGATYTSLEVARWAGPYLNKDSTAALKTGYAASIVTTFDTMTVGVSGVVSIQNVGSGIKYAIVLVPAIDNTTAIALDAAIDDGVATTGALRWRVNPGGGKDTLKLLAIPIQP